MIVVAVSSFIAMPWSYRVFSSESFRTFSSANSGGYICTPARHPGGGEHGGQGNAATSVVRGPSTTSVAGTRRGCMYAVSGCVAFVFVIKEKRKRLAGDQA